MSSPQGSSMAVQWLYSDPRWLVHGCTVILAGCAVDVLVHVHPLHCYTAATLLLHCYCTAVALVHCYCTAVALLYCCGTGTATVLLWHCYI